MSVWNTQIIRIKNKLNHPGPTMLTTYDKNLNIPHQSVHILAVFTCMKYSDNPNAVAGDQVVGAYLWEPVKRN
jgi:hypothetical protein